MYFYLIFNEHHITCGEPVYLLGNFTRLLVIDQSNQLQPCLYRSLRQVHKSTIRGMWCVVCGTEVNLFLWIMTLCDHCTLPELCKYTTKHRWCLLRLTQLDHFTKIKIIKSMFNTALPFIFNTVVYIFSHVAKGINGAQSTIHSF